MILYRAMTTPVDITPLDREQQAIAIQQSLNDYAARVLIDAIILWALGEQPIQRATT